MRPPVPSAPLALFAAVIALSVLTAGCVAQDRPHEPTFTIVADSGAEVIALGEGAALEWSHEHAIEAEPGETVHVEAELDWNASSGAHHEGEWFNFTPAAPGLVLVELNVTAENHSATDVGGVLVVPSGVGTTRAFIGVVGDIELELEGGGSFTADSHVMLGDHHGHYYSALAPGATLRLRVLQVNDEAEAALLINVQPAAGAPRVNTTAPFVFNPELNYTLVLDTSPAALHHIEVHEGADLLEDLSLPQFTEEHAGEAEGRLLVQPKGQTLPGMEAAAAVSAVAVLSLAAARRRR